ncbi:hypothetical protein Tco_0552900 [Tanacetum coccineum]
MSLNTLTQIVVKGILVADELWSVNSSVISSDRVSSPQIGGCDLDVLVRQRGFSSHVLSFAIVGTPYLRIMAGAITHGTRGRDGRGKSVGQSSCSGGRGKKALKEKLLMKHGPEKSRELDGDLDLWRKCSGGNVKGRTFGTSSLLDLYFLVRGMPSTSSTCMSDTNSSTTRDRSSGAYKTK